VDLAGHLSSVAWVAIALLAWLAVVTAVGLVSGLLALREGKDFEITFSLRPPLIRWKVTGNGEKP
jgi:hypothetical protein